MWTINSVMEVTKALNITLYLFPILTNTLLCGNEIFTFGR
jgi:hypothetical protein